jgi:CheY-like chemotaxis protein
MNPASSILVVEDNPVNLELVVDLLTNAGYRVLTANDAEAGLHVAAAEQPDLVLMDISLPGTDGLQAVSSLKSSSRTAHLPIVAVTAHAMAGDEEKARAAGCFAYLTKPIDTRLFVRQIANFLSISAKNKSTPNHHENQ